MIMKMTMAYSSSVENTQQQCKCAKSHTTRCLDATNRKWIDGHGWGHMDHGGIGLKHST